MSNGEYARGRVDARIEDAERRLDAVNGNIERMWKAFAALDRTVAGLVVKVSIGAVIGALFGSGAMTVLVYFITHG